MKIEKVTVENYKIYKGVHDFDFNGKLVLFVGENNTGKSTLFEVINFIKSGLPKEKDISDIRNKFSAKTDPVSCTIKFTGQIKQVIRDFSEPKYEKYVVVDKNNLETLTIQRSSKERTIKQNGKDVKLDIKKITIWNPELNQFENPSGIDTVISTLFETQFVWADTDPSDVSDFGATKICGRLLTAAAGDFFKSEQWNKFSEIHKETFHGDIDSLSKRTQIIEERINDILASQYGKADIHFNFSLPEPSIFYKAGEIFVNDGVDTKLNDKGTGMQRAVALAMIQVYAQSISAHPSDSEKSKPLFFFIDEPETCLHPKAQQNLLRALVEISQIRQVFISTHSPYFLGNFDATNQDLIIFNRENDNVRITPSKMLNLFDCGPSLGQINYKAYNLCTIEFHNELYGYLQENEQKYYERDIEQYFETKGIKKNKQWVCLQKGIAAPSKDVTLMTFIRNTIHHPENRQNPNFTDQELKDSIEMMMALINK
ncbi:MAG: hypothetical protein A2297_01665 [Elusimicrobia bacterium RIFOXYB2_FULL_48_7]|nr:MAG: hypothetical protein A2297_01665 [Elusimicrobia bacterium RIFOXYB2_FULL_48_7]